MKPTTNPNFAATMILLHYLNQETDLLDGHRDCTDVVPSWFYNRIDGKKFTTPKPQYAGPVRPGVYERIAAWEQDPIFDLGSPPEDEDWTEDEIFFLKQYEMQVNQWHSEKYRWDLAQELSVLRQWIYWLTRFTNMNLFDDQVMQFAGLIPPDEEDILPPDEE